MTRLIIVAAALLAAVSAHAGRTFITGATGPVMHDVVVRKVNSPVQMVIEQDGETRQIDIAGCGLEGSVAARNAATEHLRQLLDGRTLRLRVTGNTEELWMDGAPIAFMLVRRGYCGVTVSAPPALVAEARKAKAAGRGVWGR